MVKIRLQRVGTKNRPSYRIVVADVRAPRDGAFINIIGHYNPLTDPETIVIDEEKALSWLKQGAQPTDTAARLLAKLGIIERPKIPEAKPKAPKKKSETLEEKPIIPEVKSEKPEVKPEKPEVKPEKPEVKPKTPEDKLETPEVKPKTPEDKLETPKKKSKTPKE